MNKEKSDFTQGSILKKLIPFMIPILGALVLQLSLIHISEPTRH